MNISTHEVFGSLGLDGFFPEDTPYAPNSPYSASKAGSDHLVRAWREIYGLPTIITNCSNNYGPCHFPEKLIPLMILAAMDFVLAVFEEKSRLRSLLDHFALIPDIREPWRVAHPLCEVLLLVVCATMADCDGYDAIAAWGDKNLDFLRRYLPYHHGVPSGRWLTQLMNRINPALFSAVFSAWVRETWPHRPELIAIDGKTSRRTQP